MIEISKNIHRQYYQVKKVISITHVTFISVIYHRHHEVHCMAWRIGRYIYKTIINS